MFDRMLIFVGENPFANIGRFFSSIYNELATLAITVFGIGGIVLAFMLWRGSEENVPRAQKALLWTIAGFVISCLIEIILLYVKSETK